MARLTASMHALLRLVASKTSLDHDDARLALFYADRGRATDTFNEGRNAGWLCSSHDDRMESSSVRITPAGLQALKDEKETP